MKPRTVSRVSNLTSTAEKAWNWLVILWRVTTSPPLRTCQPQSHHMRGPGPKWRERSRTLQ
jgi:hypothetical protein